MASDATMHNNGGGLLRSPPNGCSSCVLRRTLTPAKNQFWYLERNGAVIFDPITVFLVPFLLF